MMTEKISLREAIRRRPLGYSTSLSLNNLCAHSRVKRPPGIAGDSIEDREHLLELVVTRTGRVHDDYRQFSSFRDLSRRRTRGTSARAGSRRFGPWSSASRAFLTPRA